MTQEEAWYFRHNGFHRVARPLPRKLVARLNANGSRRSMTLGYRAHDSHDVLKDDPEKILVRGERAYTGHPHPFPNPKKGKNQ